MGYFSPNVGKVATQSSLLSIQLKIGPFVFGNGSGIWGGVEMFQQFFDQLVRWFAIGDLAFPLTRLLAFYYFGLARWQDR
jgi:hypothetical protein